MLIGLAIVTGIVVAVVNKGEDNKDAMMASPPPPPAPESRRQLFEHKLFQPPKDAGFKLSMDEKAKLKAGSLRPTLHKR